MDLIKLLKDKKDPKLIEMITEAFVEATKESIEKATDDTSEQKLSYLKSSDSWIYQLVASIIASAKFYKRFDEIVDTFIEPGNQSEFTVSKLNATAKLKMIGKNKDLITTELIIQPTDDDFGRLLALAYYGGDFNNQHIVGDKKKLNLDGVPGYYPEAVAAAADKLRDVFFEQHKNEVENKFRDKLKEIE
jgi:hypothetical protein